jgi:eukaryotic-like serine/threonine-protein kinase
MLAELWGQVRPAPFIRWEVAAMGARLRLAGLMTSSFLLAVAPTGVAAAGPAAPTGGWTQSGAGPANTAAISSPGNLSPSTVAALGLDYSVPTGQFVTQSPAVVDGFVYAGTQSGRLLALDAATGGTRWSRPLCDGKRPAYNGAEETSPAVGSGVVWVLGDGGVLSGLSVAAPHAVVACVPIPGSEAGNGWSPTVSSGTVFAATSTRVVARDAATGASRWSRALPAGSSLASNVVVGGGRAFVAVNVGTTVGRVLALDATDGHLLWSVSRSTYVQALALAGGRLLTAGGVVQAWWAATGARAWASTVRGGDAVTVSGTRVLVAGTEATPAQGALVALSLGTGARLWRVLVGSEEESQPSAGGGVSYLVGLDTGALVMNRLSDGHRLATVAHPGAAFDELATPVVVDGHVYVFTQTGSVNQLDRWSVA